MKKSSAVPATFCAIVAVALLEGCSSPTTVRRCVDPRTGAVLPDNQCSRPVRSGVGTAVMAAAWVYGGNLSNGRVSGYSSTAPNNATIKSQDGRIISRGGLGSSGSSSSSGFSG